MLSVVKRTARRRTLCYIVSAAAMAVAAAIPAAAQRTTKAATPSARQPEILVIGTRQKVIMHVDPIASFDSQALAGIGATSMGDVMRIVGPVAKSAGGGDPIMLLNGQRVSSYEEIGSLPPEALDRVDVLPEPAALQFGYPPTRKVLNFITKRNFRQVEARVAAGSAIPAGSKTDEAGLNLTRLHKDRRFTLALERSHTSALLQSRRHILADPDLLFDAAGNVTAPNGGEIDPALSALAGQTVTVAPVPAGTNSLSGFAAGANRPRLFDIGPYNFLSPKKDHWKAEAVAGDKLGGSISGTLALSALQESERSQSGPAAVTLTVPGTNPFSLFSQTVLLHRYLVEVDSLHTQKKTTTLHAGGTFRGAISGWLWDLTTNADYKRVSGFSENGIDTAKANAAVAAGANPFAPLDQQLLAARLVDRAHLATRTTNAKLVVTGRPLHLPAGDVTLIGSTEAEGLSTSSVTRGADPFSLHIGRTRTEGSLALDVPLTSRTNHALAAIGDLSLNASANVRRVSGFGVLNDRTAGLSWTPFKGIQLFLQDKQSGTAPDMESLASPIVHVANFPIFDYATGRTEVVTLTTGGNPHLLAERKHERSIALNVKPFPKHEWRISTTYLDTEIRNQTGNIYGLSPQLEPIYPDRFVRDAAGRLVSVTFQPTNFYRERQKTLNIVVNLSGQAGKKGKDPKTGKDKARASYWAGAGPVIRFSDRLQVRPTAPILDLLRGDSATGAPTPRVTSYFYAGIGYLGNDVNIDGWYQARSRVRSDLPASDLFFSSVFKLNFHAAISVHHFTPKMDWTHHLQVKLDIENLINAREKAQDRSGRVPYRFQPDLLEPIGRTVKLTLRKVF